MSDAPSASDAEQPRSLLDSREAPATELEAEQNTAAEQLSKNKSASGTLSMEVKVYSPFKTYFEGTAFSISGENPTGPFDILPRHHNFITLLSPCELTVRSSKSDEKIQIGGGIMHVKADQVIVFLDV